METEILASSKTIKNTSTWITNQQAEMINFTYKSNDDVYTRVDTLKSESDLNTLPFPRKSTE